MSENTQEARTEQADDQPNPYDDAEFVIYSTSEEQIEYEAQTEVGEDTGFVNISLWARFPDEGRELPLFSYSEQGVWLSLDADQALNSDADTVSAAFKQAIGNLTDDDEAGWCNVEEDIWQELSLPERYMVGQFRRSIIGGRPAPELVMAMQALNDSEGEFA